MLRIREVNGRIAGCGFLVTEQIAFTCAHVVNAALGRAGTEQSKPTDQVVVDFPRLSSQHSAYATVIGWRPIADDGTGDMAMLELADLRFDGPLTLPLLRYDQDLFFHEHFAAFGFPSHRANGRWISGSLLAQEETGWVQLEAAGEPLVLGFSGTPIVTTKYGGVVGMAVALDAQTRATSFMIPTTELMFAFGLDPALLVEPQEKVELPIVVELTDVPVVARAISISSIVSWARQVSRSDELEGRPSTVLVKVLFEAVWSFVSDIRGYSDRRCFTTATLKITNTGYGTVHGVEVSGIMPSGARILPPIEPGEDWKTRYSVVRSENASYLRLRLVEDLRAMTTVSIVAPLGFEVVGRAGSVHLGAWVVTSATEPGVSIADCEMTIEDSFSSQRSNAIVALPTILVAVALGGYLFGTTWPGGALGFLLVGVLVLLRRISVEIHE